MDSDAQLSLLRESPLLQPDWYRATYPDVAMLGMEPARHYLAHGAGMGRAPGPGFDTRFYLATYPDVAGSGLNPLVHYLLHGRAEGRVARAADQGPPDAARARIGAIRSHLLTLGFTAEPLAALAAILDAGGPAEARALAARELALWHLRGADARGWQRARGLIAQALALAGDTDPEPGFRAHLRTAELLCLHRLGASDEARRRFDAIAEPGADLLLARAGFEATPEARCAWVNRALARHGIAPVTLTDEAALPAFDRLAPAAPPRAIATGPLVTVLLAAHDAEATIATALRALGAQTWRNLEIVVIDDASTDATGALVVAHAAHDPRIRLIRLATNVGAYGARNRGLAAATGAFVTLHDADDWSHPDRIAVQVRHLLDNPAAVGCTSEQARATADLAFTRWTGPGALVARNHASFLFRRAPVVEALGCWDSVRFGADNEFIRRVGRVFGPGAVATQRTGPLTFQRVSESSILASGVHGMAGFYFGARKEYADAQRRHHASGASLRYTPDPGPRPFPAPVAMLPDRAARLARPRHFDVVFMGEFRQPTPLVARVAAQVRLHRAAGRHVGLVEMPLYDPALAGSRTAIHDILRAEIDGQAVEMLVFGDRATCTRLETFGRDPALTDLRYLPDIAVPADADAADGPGRLVRVGPPC